VSLEAVQIFLERPMCASAISAAACSKRHGADRPAPVQAFAAGQRRIGPAGTGAQQPNRVRANREPARGKAVPLPVGGAPLGARPVGVTRGDGWTCPFTPPRAGCSRRARPGPGCVVEDQKPTVPRLQFPANCACARQAPIRPGRGSASREPTRATADRCRAWTGSAARIHQITPVLRRWAALGRIRAAEAPTCPRLPVR